MNLSLSLNCSELGVVSTRDCECACLSLAKCATPRCAYAVFTRSCAEHGSCEDTCSCREFLCSFAYTPQATNTYWAKKARAEKAYDDEGKLVVTVAGCAIASACLVLLMHEAVTRLVRRAPPQPVELPDEGIG